MLMEAICPEETETKQTLKPHANGTDQGRGEGDPTTAQTWGEGGDPTTAQTRAAGRETPR